MAKYYKLDEDQREEIIAKLKRRKELLHELGTLTNKALHLEYGCSKEVVRCMYNKIIEK